MPTEKSFLLAVKEYLLITIGILCYVSGWSLFLLPNNLVGGGVSGLSSIIQYATGFKMGYTYFIVNAGLLVIAFLILGAGFGGKTIYAIILASVGLSVLPDIIPLQIIDTLALQNGKLMSVIMGGIMAGVGTVIADDPLLDCRSRNRNVHDAGRQYRRYGYNRTHRQ